MSIVLVQSKQGTVSVNSCVLTPSGLCQVNDTLVVIAANAPGNAGHSITVTDNNFNKYSFSTLRFTDSGSHTICQVFWKSQPSLTNNPPTITVSDSAGASNNVWASFREYSGLNIATLDVEAGATVTSTTSAVTDAINTTGITLLLEVFCDFSASSSITGTGSWTDIHNTTGGVALAGDQLNALAGPYTGTATLASASASWIAAIVALKGSYNKQHVSVQQRF